MNGSGGSQQPQGFGDLPFGNTLAEGDGWQVGRVRSLAQGVQGPNQRRTGSNCAGRRGLEVWEGPRLDKFTSARPNHQSARWGSCHTSGAPTGLTHPRVADQLSQWGTWGGSWSEVEISSPQTVCKGSTVPAAQVDPDFPGGHLSGTSGARRRSKCCVALKSNRRGLAGADDGRLMVGCGSLIPSALPTLSGMFSGWFCPGDDCAWSWALSLNSTALGRASTPGEDGQLLPLGPAHQQPSLSAACTSRTGSVSL